RTMAAVVASAAAVSVKPLPLVLLPLFWKWVRPRDAAAGAACLALLALPFVERRALPMVSLDVYLEKYRFNGPLFARLESFTGAAAAAVIAVAAGLAVATILRARRAPACTPSWTAHTDPTGARGGSTPPATGDPAIWAWPQATALLFAPVVYPWYLLWLLPFVGGRAGLPLGVWTASVIATNAVWIHVRAGLGWTLPGWVYVVEFGAPALALLVAAAARLRRRTPPQSL
ncbi:MAG TPA: hypothetical protein VNK92_05230, partial [Vicinamibacterales bacterium]|nr:hypothetical protein [Vicinamibacterales bacterium]